MRALVAGIFAVAVAASLLTGDGLVLVPHTHAPGTPAEHPHGLALYRFPIALLGEPADAPRYSAQDQTSASFRMATSPPETLIGASLLLIGVLAVAAVAASWRHERSVAVPVLGLPQWSQLAPTGPPRALPIV